MAKSMIPKDRRKHPKKAPVDVYLTVRFRFGESPDDCITMIEQRKVPMVNSVFDNRDRIIRQFVKLLVLGSVKSPRVVRELSPLRAMKRRFKG